MSHAPKLAILILFFALISVLISCDWFDWYPCGQYDYTGNKIQFENSYFRKYYSKDSLQYHIFQFSFYEDSSFSYLRIMHQKNHILQDTLTMLNGKFKVYKDSGFPWHVLRLNADSIYEKETKDTLDGILHFTDFASGKFEGLGDSLFYIMSAEDYPKVWEGCLGLRTKYSAPCQNDWDGPCLYKKDGKYWGLEYGRNFCPEQPGEEPQLNTTGDSL